MYLAIWYLSCHIIFTWFMLLTTFIQPKSIFLFISIPYPNKVYNKQRTKYFSVVICVCCTMSYSEIILSLNGIFQHSTGCAKKFFSFRQPWWRFLVYTSLISQFRENVISFHFLANALCFQHCNKDI